MKKRRFFSFALSALLALLCLAPFVYVLLRGARNDAGAWTTQNYYKVFLAEPGYLIRFWKSLGIAACITLGQLIVSILAGFGFAKYKFPGKNVLYFLLMALMLMPLQVTLVPNYIVLQKMELLNTYHALILPAIFVPLGIFLLTQTFKAVPNEVLDAARLDGCSTLGILAKVAIPMNKGGVACTLLLPFLDGWNMVEQPMVFLENFRDYPVSVALATVSPGTFGVQLACCALVMIPPILLFLVFDRELVEGITMGEMK